MKRGKKEKENHFANFLYQGGQFCRRKQKTREWEAQEKAAASQRRGPSCEQRAAASDRGLLGD